MRYATLLTFSLLFSGGLFAQANQPWTLERAVQYALDNNLQIQQSQLFEEQARLQLAQAKNNKLPTVSGSSNVGLQFGRTIDPTTNSFDQQTIGFQGYQVQAGVTLYNGGLIKNRERRAEIAYAQAKTNTKVSNNDNALLVANSYLNIVLLREQLANARAQLALTEGQLDNTNRLIDAGALPPAQRFDLQAQAAANQRSIVELENQADMAVLGLKLLLQLDYTDEFSVATPEIELTEAQLLQEYNLEEVFLSARGIQPTILAAELQREAAEMDIEIAKAGLRPTVTVFGSVSTNFSTAAKDFSQVEPGEPVLGPAIPVEINGETATLAEFRFPSANTGDLPTIGYVDQLDRNFGQSVGMTINVPIYSQGRNKNNIQQAKVTRELQAVNIELAENNLRNDVELALTNLRAAQQTYRAAAVSLDASQTAYDNAQRSFRAGAANSLDLVQATNRLDQARTELTRSKYQLIFNRQVIRFYLGQGLTFE
ncbi:MAG: TolC family protein [Bacteroidota bacterium]